MIESIKRDRVTQILIVVAVLVGLIVCFIFAAVGLRYANRDPAPQASPVPAISPTPLVYSFKGVGDKVVFFDAPASGAGLIGFGHTGESNFIVNLMKDDGTFIDQPANAIGEYEGEKTLVIDKGRYMLEVQADGEWFIAVLPPQ